MYDISFSTPEWLIIYYNSISCISLFMNILGMYLLIFECKDLGTYRYYLLFFLVCCTMTDLHLTLLFQPIPLYPIIAGWSKGLLSLYLKDPLLIAMTVMFTLCILHLESLLHCFVNKHQLLAKIQNEHVLPKWLDISFRLIAITAPLVPGAWFPSLGVSKEEQWRYIAENHREYLEDFKSLPSFLIFPKSLSLNLFLLFLLLGGFGILIMFFVFMTGIFYIMKSLKTKMAKSTYKKHSDAVRSLQVQLVTAIICIIPPGFIVFIVLLEFYNAQLLTEIAIAWYGTHAVLNMTSMLIFFSPFRKWIKKRYEKITGKIQDKSRISIVIVSQM